MNFFEVQSMDPAENTPRSKLGYYNLLVRRRLASAVESLGIIEPGNAMKEVKKKGNLFSLSPGSHGGAAMSMPDTEIHGLGPGAVVNRPVSFTSDAVVDGVTFSTGEGPASVRVNGTAVVVLRNCTFERPEDDVFSHIAVATGAKAIVLGCVFRGSGTTAVPVVNHGGAAANVQIGFCYNKTGNTLFTGGTATSTGNV